MNMARVPARRCVPESIMPAAPDLRAVCGRDVQRMRDIVMIRRGKRPRASHMNGSDDAGVA
jgi:hypothetical protein